MRGACAWCQRECPRDEQFCSVPCENAYEDERDRREMEEACESRLEGVEAERDRYHQALVEIWDHPTDMACDGECAARMNALAGHALNQKEVTDGR